MSFLRLTSLSVRRMPGIADGGWRFAELAAGINVVYGPNASGKTTTARAIEALFWPSAAPATAWIEATLQAGADRWWAELDAGASRFQKNDSPAQSPNVLPVESRGRYHLPLHELLRGEDLGLAHAIALESAGGYDLAAAADIVGPRTSLSRPRREQDALHSAREKLRVARGAQERLQLEAASLAEDEARLARIPELESRLAMLELAKQYATRDAEARDAARRLSSYHPAIARLAGDEHDRFRDLRERFRRAEAGAQSAAEEADAVRAELAENPASPRLLDGSLTRALQEDLTALETVDAQIRSDDIAFEEGRGALETEARRLGVFADPEAAAGLDPEGLATLVRAAEALHGARSRREALEAELGAIGDADGVSDRGVLERASQLLQQWLRSPSLDAASEKRLKWTGALAAALLVVAGLAVATAEIWGFGIAIVGGILLIATLLPQARGDARPAIQADYLELGAPITPEAWTVDAVRHCLDSLTAGVAEARFAEARRARREPLLGALGEAQEEEDALSLKLAEVSERFGLTDHAEVGLVLLLERISKLQDTRNTLARIDGRRVGAWQHRSDILARANSRLVDLDVGIARDAASLRAIVEKLEDEADERRAAEQKIKDSDNDRRHFQRAAAEAREEIGRLASHLGVEELDDATLKSWCSQREEMIDARGAFDGVDRERKRLEEALRSARGFDEALMAPDVPQLEEEIRELRSRLEELDGLRDRVVDLRGEVQRAKQSHDVEEALAEVAEAERALREVRDRDARAHIAARLVAHVEERSRNEHRPEVFHRANQIFGEITRGRYQLRLEDGTDPSFRAFDTQRQKTQPLEELSSATRVQLLLAVRVAFVEVQESGLGLPLLLDETLANSDRERAAAVIDALITLADTGRQIFYFTAQVEEVRRWRNALDARSEVDGRIIDLAEIRRLEQAIDEYEIEEVLAPPVRFPSPNGGGHAEYGKALGVPAVDPVDPPGSLHLWYLVEDSDTLHHIMSTLAVETWGSFRSLIESGGRGFLDERLANHVEALGMAAETILQRLRIGHGRPVDRRVLQESGAVSENFIDEVTELARSLDGDAARLIEALSDRTVAKFLQKKTEALAEFFDEEGYLDPRPRLRPQQIRIEVFRDLSGLLARGEITRDEVERLLGRLGVKLRREIESVQADLQLW